MYSTTYQTKVYHPLIKVPKNWLYTKNFLVYFIKIADVTDPNRHSRKERHPSWTADWPVQMYHAIKLCRSSIMTKNRRSVMFIIILIFALISQSFVVAQSDVVTVTLWIGNTLQSWICFLTFKTVSTDHLLFQFANSIYANVTLHARSKKHPNCRDTQRRERGSPTFLMQVLQLMPQEMADVCCRHHDIPNLTGQWRDFLRIWVMTDMCFPFVSSVLFPSLYPTHFSLVFTFSTESLASSAACAKMKCTSTTIRSYFDFAHQAA